MTAPTERRTAILAMAGLALVLFLVSLDQTIVGTAMPRIIADLNGFELYAWVTTAYLLAETAVIPIVGKLGDLYGRKWITVAGVVLFVGTSALCGMAGSMPALVLFRGLQGLGGGMLMATVFTLVADIFPDLGDRARYQGFLFATFSLSSVVGPVLGGWITDSLSWRWVFYVNLPLGLLALAVLPAVLPTTARQLGAKIDYLGALTSTLAVVGLLGALELVGAGAAWDSPLVLGGLALALVAGAAFIPIERHAAEPLIPLSLLRNRTVAVSTAVTFLVGITMFTVSLYIPLFVQGVRGASASSSGTVMMPMVITMSAMGIVAGQLIARVGRLKPFLLAGTGLASLGLLLLTLLGAESGLLQVGGTVLVIGLGMGMVMPVATLAVQAAVEQRMLGVATSATNFIRSIGATMGTALVGTLVTSAYRASLTASAPEGAPEAAVRTLESPNALTSAEALAKLAELTGGSPEALLEAARIALAGAIHNGFLAMLGAGLLAVACAALLPNLTLGARSRPSVVVSPEQPTAPDAPHRTGPH
ncbi:MAG: MFS transporter [Chloroflexales bacterium]|nr:MFS transporter [Chloroflexales bacterium]